MSRRDPQWEQQLAEWRTWLDSQQEQPELDSACKRIASALLGGDSR